MVKWLDFCKFAKNSTCFSIINCIIHVYVLDGEAYNFEMKRKVRQLRSRRHLIAILTCYLSSVACNFWLNKLVQRTNSIPSVLHDYCVVCNVHFTLILVIVCQMECDLSHLSKPYSRNRPIRKFIIKIS